MEADAGVEADVEAVVSTPVRLAMEIVNLSWVPVMDGSHEGQCRLI